MIHNPQVKTHSKNICRTSISFNNIALQQQIYKIGTNIPDKEQGYDHMNDAIGYLIDVVKPLTIQSSSFTPTRWNVKNKQQYVIHTR